MFELLANKNYKILSNYYVLQVGNDLNIEKTTRKK